MSEIETPPTSTASPKLLGARARVPQSVVFRSFPTEMVVLNLTTGRYHGLNPSAGRMLEAMIEADTVRDAASVIAASYGQPTELVERDLCALCRTLLERGLIEVDDGDIDG